MSEYEDADVQVMGIFLLSLKRGQNKGEEDYISWLLQEHSLQNTFRANWRHPPGKQQYAKVAPTNTTLNQAKAFAAKNRPITY